jgi:(p)ppGpp synthase/HD superfamily hydrolase
LTRQKEIAEFKIMSLIELAKSIATKAHEGQTRRDGKTPYIEHPKAVVLRLLHENEKVIAAAWLHDVLEDCDVTVFDLRRAGIPWQVTDAVEFLTKRDDQDYEDYLHWISLNDIAHKVKIADMLANLSDAPTKKQIKKYAKGLLFLLGD